MTIESTLERIAIALEILAAAPKIEVTDAPKRTRGKAATAAETSPATTAPAARVAENAPAKEAATAATDDLFGSDEPVKEEKKEPKFTIDNVKAKLVEVQTALKHKDHAIALLAKHTVPKGTKVLSALPEANWGALIAEADVSIKAGKVS